MGCKSSKVKNAETRDPVQSKVAVNSSTENDQVWSGSPPINAEPEPAVLSPPPENNECEYNDVSSSNHEQPKMWTAPETKDGEPKECSPFEGKWKDVGVVTGTMLLDWKGETHELAIASSSAISLVVGGAKYHGTLQNNQVSWDDGDVWVRHDTLVARKGDVYMGQRVEVVGGCCSSSRNGTVCTVRTDGSVVVKMNDEGENEIVAADDIFHKIRNPIAEAAALQTAPKRGWGMCCSKADDITPDKELQEETTHAICNFSS